MTVVAYAPDLMDGSRFGGRAIVVRTPGDLLSAAAAEGVELVVVDASRAEVLETVQQLTSGVRIVAFAPHVDDAARAAAVAAGCDEVLPRSVFFRRLPELLGVGP